MDFFTPREFGEWFDRMDPEFLVKLDLFRYRWGAPVELSPAAGALGREGSPESQHHWKPGGTVRAGDLLPVGITTQEDARRAIALATECGFRGIGLYPHWAPMPGLHLDVRVDRRMGEPALWGALRVNGAQTYVPLTNALKAMP
jgi:hypothetical protein